MNAIVPIVAGPLVRPRFIAEIIYVATTDGTDQLRYKVGADAVQMLAGQRATDDATFTGIEP